MIYPNNFEQKIGFDEIRELLKARCLSTLGKEKVDEMTFSTDVDAVNEWLSQVREFRRLQEEKDDFPMQYFFDVRESIRRIRLENTHLEENEVWDLRRSLQTIADIVKYLERGAEETANGETRYPYPALHRLTEDVQIFPAIIRRIDSILDKFGKINPPRPLEDGGQHLAYLIYYLARCPEGRFGGQGCDASGKRRQTRHPCVAYGETQDQWYRA